MVGFFRRSIQKQIEYRCLRDGKCLVIRLNRNRCQYCRFKKCLAVGMSRDSVRYGRVPKRSREREGDGRGEGSEMVAREVENKQLAIYDIILTISQAHHANCSYTEEKTRALVRKPIIFNTSEVSSDPEAASSTMDTLEHQKITMWQSFAVFMTPSIQRVVEFAKRVPGFSELSQDDQLILIKVGFFELWLTHISRMISSVDNTLTFSDGSYVTRSQMEMMFDQDFVTTIFNFAMSFNNLNLNDTELALFTGVVLLTAERPGITDTKVIEQAAAGPDYRGPEGAGGQKPRQRDTPVPQRSNEDARATADRSQAPRTPELVPV
ncbi:ecdysone-induced protein 78c [Penaeus vannamei]|uniref:Ecdysone-induced protein 78c n=1 Tax=Penaeus vannamei TaxID=6689 RepID=A0A3R7LQQ5_PENVA|nr:ecdysone-induced protein 78c [Penaeus vannamei]